MFPWKVVGCDEWTNENGEECVRLYVERQFNPEEGHTGAGVETQRIYYKKKYVDYNPVLNHLIIAVDGRYGISQIVVVGQL